MSRLRSLTIFALTALLTVSSFTQATAAGVQWQRDLKSAAAEAERSGKPILIQFTASWCGYCHKMLRETYPDREIAARINEYFVPVVLDADDNEQVVEAVGVDAFPTAVIISPELDVIGKIEGFYQPRQFAQRITPFCKKPQVSVTQTAVLKGDALPTAKPVSAEQPAPVVAFDGLCLVSMLDNRKRLTGDERITHEYRGVLLQFASESERKAFLSKPERYWPVANGDCPVATVNGEQTTFGDSSTCAVYRDQLILFRDLEHRAEFAKAPQQFMQRLTTTLASRRSSELK